MSFFCPKCKSLKESADVGSRMRLLHQVPYWEIEQECLTCLHRVWTPSNKPRRKEDETLLQEVWKRKRV